MGAIEGKVPNWGGGVQNGEIDVGEALFGSTSNQPVDKDTEWEVCPIAPSNPSMLILGICHRR